MDDSPLPPSVDSPTTDRGAAVSAANAVTHGLTATRHLPAAMESRRNALLAELDAELRPTSALERIFVAELARHAAGLEVAATIEPAVLRRGVQQGAQLTELSDAANADAEADAALTAAVASDALQRTTRYRRGHEHGLFRALDKLSEARQLVAQVSSQPPRFQSEEECEAHLRGRMLDPSWRCPGCFTPKGYWIAGRFRWECASCRRQFGLRAGTVLERSPLPLLLWFRAIEAVVQRPELTAAELAAELGLSRRATAAEIQRRISSALRSTDRDRLLAGLPAILARELPERSVQK